MKKLSKSTYGFIFAIIALVILLGVTLYLGISGWFYANVTKLESDVTLGQTLNLNITETGAKVASFTFPGSFLPGQKLDQNINITNSSENDMFVRAKAVIFDCSDQDMNLELGISEHWTENGDYFYFDQPLLKSNKISLASYVRLRPDKYYNSTKTYVFTIVVEAIDSNLSRSEVWGY